MTNTPRHRLVRPRPWVGALMMAIGTAAAVPSWAAIIEPPPPANETSTTPAPAPRNPRLPYAVGDHLEARVGDIWIPAQVHAITKVRTSRGMELGYGVTLANGKKAIVSPKLLRKPASR